MKKIGLLFIPLVFAAMVVNAQPGWNWGDQVDVAKEKNAIYTDMVNVLPRALGAVHLSDNRGMDRLFFAENLTFPVNMI